MRVSVGDVKLFFDVEGTSLVADGDRLTARPTLILVHGGPGYDHASFRLFFPSFSDVAQIIYLDLRGNGRSDRGDASRWTLDQWADDLERFCSALEIEKPVILGNSFGGFVALNAALRHPSLAAKLILVSTTGRLRIDRALSMFEKLGGAAIREVAERFWGNPTPENFAEYQEKCIPYYCHRPPPPEVRKRSIYNLELLHHFYRLDGEGRHANLLENLHLVHVPTLILAGMDDPITTFQDARDLSLAFPSEYVRLEGFPGARHAVLLDDPDGTRRSMRRFITDSSAA